MNRREFLAVTVGAVLSTEAFALPGPPGVTIEQDMTAHRKYILETLHAGLTR